MKTCSFCDGLLGEPLILIEAPDGNTICDACVELATDKLFEDDDDDDPDPPPATKIIRFADAVATLPLVREMRKAA